MPPFWITTSWDDGHPLDWRIVEKLNQYGLRGTFYIVKDYLPERLSEDEIKALAQQHEVGAHTITHPILTKVELSQARQEIVESKQWLEQVTGKAIEAFCYPRGARNQAIRDAVRDAGYVVARAVEKFSLDKGTDPWAIPTTTQVYPFPFRPVDSLRARFEPIRYALPHVLPLHIPLVALRSWPALAIALLERAAATGGVWHLWGHSWEIDKYQMWDDLDVVLAAAGRYASSGRAVTNAELVKEMSELNA
jgi:peptidoglycan/xylan/chitin deacetylase (PgdA/CDA1 family)